ncbi:glutathione S-transferase LANCL1 [Lasioglossum baleicum]|uniref:glutathione S-transferase LANCL1 n=1 Tax=Lasioglossum baleicum TaxID=434251 RepID=UPI003FCDF74B
MLVEKIGYATIVYWGYKLTRDVIYKIYKNYYSRSTVDLHSMGKWAVVTGCSHGIGRAYAEALAKTGLNVILVSPDTENLKTIATSIEVMYNVKTKVIKLDLSEGLDTYNVIEKEMFGLEIGVLINNLGMSYPHPEYFLDLPHKEKIYMSIIHCNVVVVTNMCRILLPQMVVRGKGVIVNVASMVAVLPSPLLTVFAATKAYIVKFSRDLQIEYAKHGIIVQCLLPGTVTNHTLYSPKPGSMVPTPEKYVQSAMKSIGKDTVTTGFLQHSILITMIKLIYRASPTSVVLWMINVMEGNRNNVLRRYIGRALNVNYINNKIGLRTVNSVQPNKMENTRYYDNPFEEYPNSKAQQLVNADTKEVSEEYKKILHKGTKRLLELLEKNRKHWLHHDDCSVYTGSAGIAYVYYHCGKCFNEPSYIDVAEELLQSCANKFRGRHEYTFLTGIAGPMALYAVVLYSQGNNEASQNIITKLKSLSPHVMNQHSDIPDELLYGRVGYLFSLLFLNKHISPPPVEDELIRQIVTATIKSGNSYAASRKYKTPLMYAWHDSEYLGGAHGLGGILYLLLQARPYLTESQLESDIKPALQFLVSLRYPSGNFPSSIGSKTDKLVHWCHGAPGMPMLFCLAYEIYKDEKYLDIALQCGEVIWKRGLLKKGYGICHGVAGNAYTFLCLFQQTKDAKHLYRACKFAEWCMDYGSHRTMSPDRPFSLFEGLAGTIYFLLDMQSPLSAKFPAYTV